MLPKAVLTTGRAFIVTDLFPLSFTVIFSLPEANTLPSLTASAFTVYSPGSSKSKVNDEPDT